MGKYQNGLETQEKILDACRVLFYEKDMIKRHLQILVR